MSKINKKIYSILFLLLNLLSHSFSQNLDKSTLKAAGCLTLVKKLKDKPEDQRVMTGLLLSCFINVDEETADKLLQNQFYDKMGIEESEVLKLIDFNKIQSKYSQQQIEEYSKALNIALEPLREKRPRDRQGQDQNPYDYEGQDNDNNESNESIVNYLIKLFTSSDSLLFLVGLFVVFYFCLQKMRKWFGKSDKSSNNKANYNTNQKSNKNSKSNKKKRK